MDRIERIKAFQSFKELREKRISRKRTIDEINKKFRIPKGTLYTWYSNTHSPLGSTGTIENKKELFYVLGALLGDGCTYKWKKGGSYSVIIIGDKKFTEKYAEKISICSGRKAKTYINRSKNIWFVNTGNAELFLLFNEIRADLRKLSVLMRDGKRKENALEFIEGFFDAEGCVKIIKEEVRKTPKICLDITNTDHKLLEVIRKLLVENLGIKAKYSIQKPFKGKDGFYRKKIYHLRIYKKEFIRRFFDNIETIKLKQEKIPHVENWLNREITKDTISSQQQNSH